MTAVDSAPKLEMLRTIGADRVIDYAQEDFTDSPETYDVIFDVVRNTPSGRMVRLLTENGWLLMANPGFLQIVRARWASRGSKKRVSFAASGVDERGPGLPAGPGRSGTAAPGHRPALPARADGRGSQVRRNRPEAGERRCRRRIAAAAIAASPRAQQSGTNGRHADWSRVIVPVHVQGDLSLVLANGEQPTRSGPLARPATRSCAQWAQSLPTAVPTIESMVDASGATSAPVVLLLFWRARRDSNPRPSDPKSDALSAELRARDFVLHRST